PQWVQDATAYLRDVSDLPSWHAVVDGWLRLEHLMRYPDNKPPNRLPTSDRPEEVGAWMSSRSYTQRPAVKVKPFSAQWKKWYSGVQPKSRDTTTWPFKRDVSPDNCDWGVLLRGGPNGFFLIIVSLSWW
ncbi:hypothetical protein K474DRAFT_1572838, partial [Panus rudis PR-1116 ss-1]